MIFFSPIRDLTAYLGSMRDPDKSGILTIYAHGGPNAVNGPSLINRFGDRLNANQLADLIRGKVENGKTPGWLKACDTGEDPEGFAQQLANSLGVTVFAPTTNVWINNEGVVGPFGKNSDGSLNLSDPGRYTQFYPNSPIP